MNRSRGIKIMATAGAFLLLPKAAWAANPRWYLQNADIMACNNMASSALRSVIWGVTKVLVDFANACEKLYDTAFGFIDITSGAAINAFIAAYKPAFVALMALSILYLGIILILQHEKKPKIGINICLCVLCVCCSTFLFSQMNQLAHSFKDGVGATTRAEKMAYDTVDSHMADLVRLNEIHKGLGSVNWKSKEEYGAGITGAKTFDAVDFTEVLNYRSSKYIWHGDTEDILKHKVITKYSGKKPVYDTAEISNGWFWNNADDTDLGNEFYYRYSFDFISAWMEILALMIIYICMSYKCVRVAYELVVARLLAYLYSAELSGGEKIRKILVFIRDSYILLVVTAICIRIYALINAYLEGQTNISGIPKGMIMLFIAFSVIDGPNLVEKLLGMDAGLKSSTARILAIGRIGFGVTRAASPKGIANTVNNIRSGRMSQGGIAAGAVGAAMGARNEQSGKREGGLMGRSRSGNENSRGAGISAGAENARGAGQNQSSGACETSRPQAGSGGTSGETGQRSSGERPAGNASGTAGGTGRGPKGDRGDRGADRQNSGTDFMNESRSAEYQADAHASCGPAFMEEHRSSGLKHTKSRSSTGGSSALPQRETRTNSRIMDQRKGRDRK